MIQDNPLASSKWWHIFVWKGQGPLKCNVFLWLLLEGKILTWDILVKKRWVCPGFCVLYWRNDETITHLFIHFPFVISIWKVVFSYFNLDAYWN